MTSIIALIVVMVLGYAPSLGEPTASSFGLFGLIAVSTGMVALMIYYRGLSKTPVHISTMLELAFPFIAIFIDMTLYHTTLDWSQYVAAVLLSFAIYKIAKLQSNAISVTTN
jgi:drug/metabolite transporter (DMT)-like permease